MKAIAKRLWLFCCLKVRFLIRYDFSKNRSFYKDSKKTILLFRCIFWIFPKKSSIMNKLFYKKIHTLRTQKDVEGFMAT